MNPIQRKYGEATTVYFPIYTAAGDELYGVSETFVTPAPPNFTSGIFTGSVTIIGGTGRFAEATGGWDFVNASYDGPNSVWQIDGSITY